MKNNTRKLVSYALTISMLFSAANTQERKNEHAILPEKITLEEVQEDKKLKKALK